VELPSIRVRRAAFDASTFMRNELWARTMRDNDVVGGLLLQQDKQELEKQRASFAEVANFAVALYKQNEQYKEEWTKVLVAYGDLWDRYQELYKVADDAVHLAEKALYRSPGLSLPVFVNVPTPQVIRVEARAVPRSLYCTANTVDMSLGGSTTWTDCRW
jgi:hypothetical protein